jgi:tetratricopeptide (TPR) repeat protein
MKSRFWLVALAAATMALSSLIIWAQAASSRIPYDITDYKITADIQPENNSLKATADVTFIPLQDTRSVTFELNGALKVDSITRENNFAVSQPASQPAAQTGQPGVTAPPILARDGKPAAKNVKPAATPKPSTPSAGATGITFVQDQAGEYTVRVDLGEYVKANAPVTLRFKYSGVLVTADGGPLINKRLAAVAADHGYLFYASRWFPFHDYAADRATSDITLNVPAGWAAAGYSDTPVVQTGKSYHFVQSKPALVGNFAFGKYNTKTLHYGDYEINFLYRPGSDAMVQNFGETIGKAMEYYTKQYGKPDAGNKMNIVEIDDESLDYYSGQGIMFLANTLFDRTDREGINERLQREAALQWWGLTVGLKSFDDAWVSQGLAEWSAIQLRESTASPAELYNLQRETLEKALTFEQTSSIARAPSTQDDQSNAYQYIMFAKGAFVYRLLRETLGKPKFDQLLHQFLETYRGKNASIDDFEKLSSKIAGDNLRYFFARWVEGTGVPEFQVDYLIIRTKSGKFVTRGTVKENYDNLRLPVEVMLRSEGENENKRVTLHIDDSSEDFNIESSGKPLEVVIDPDNKILHISDDLRVSAIARRGIELFKEGKFAEAQQQFDAALKLDRSNSWIYYHLGALYLEQRNYDQAVDNFKAVLTGDLRPGWLQVWANIKMGNAYDAKGDRTRAVAAYKRAQDTDDNYDNALELAKKYLANPFDPKEKTTTTAIR